MWSLALQGETQGVWFFGALYALAACGYSSAYQLRIRSWPSTIGVLHSASVKVFGYRPNDRSETQYKAQACYSYGVSDASYEGHRVSPWLLLSNMPGLLGRQLSGIQRDPSGAVQVYYHPKRPAKSFLVLPGKLGLVVTLALGLLPLLGYLNRYHI